MMIKCTHGKLHIVDSINIGAPAQKEWKVSRCQEWRPLVQLTSRNFLLLSPVFLFSPSPVLLLSDFTCIVLASPSWWTRQETLASQLDYVRHQQYNNLELVKCLLKTASRWQFPEILIGYWNTQLWVHKMSWEQMNIVSSKASCNPSQHVDGGGGGVSICVLWVMSSVSLVPVDGNSSQRAQYLCKCWLFLSLTQITSPPLNFHWPADVTTGSSMTQLKSVGWDPSEVHC